MTEPTVDVFPDATALVAAAAGRFIDTVVAAQAERGSASVVLTGGGIGGAALRAIRKRGRGEVGHECSLSR